MLTSLDGIRLRIKILIFPVILLALGVAGRFAWIQVVRHKYYTQKSTGRFNKNKEVRGIRGRIFDRNGFLLAGNNQCYTIVCDPYNLGLPPAERLHVARIFVKYFGKPLNYYTKRLFPKRKRNKKTGKIENVYLRYILLERWASPELKDRFDREISQYFDSVVKKNRESRKLAKKQKSEKIIKKIKYPNGFLNFKETSYRFYPKHRLAANILGFINVSKDEHIPQSGLEQSLNRQMAPQKNSYSYDLRDGNKSRYDLQKEIIRNGNDVYLTISEPIQAILEEELDFAYRQSRPDVIYAAIADPATGEILAMAQRPTFDPNDRSTFSVASFRNRLIEDTYEPGSLMKPITVGKALDWNIISPGDEIDCENGRWFYLGKPISDSHNYGNLTVGGVIQKSSNIGTAKIALKMGIDKLMTAFKTFRFGEISGLGFPGEQTGKVTYPRKGDGLSITRYSYGYGVRISALQMLRAYIGLASPDGMPDLRLIKRISDPAAGREEETKTVPVKRKIFENESARKQLVDMMISVTQPGGTSTHAAVPGYYVAGKTGTSRKYKAAVKGQRGPVGYSTKEYFASFAGFVPAHNPRLVMVLTFDNPKTSIYGGTIAGPVFRRTAERILRYWSVPYDYTPETPKGKKKR